MIYQGDEAPLLVCGGEDEARGDGVLDRGGPVCYAWNRCSRCRKERG